MNLDAEDNWEDVPEYHREGVDWREADKIVDGVLYVAEVDQHFWGVRMNDFPAEPLYTLIVDGQEIINFNDWPSEWVRPKVTSLASSTV